VVDRSIVIGRSLDADFHLDDPQTSRHHARVSPYGDALVVQDLESANGTFVNHNEVHSSVRLDPGDELLVGVTVMSVRTDAQVAAEPSAVRAIPPALAIAESAPQYVNTGALADAPVVQQPLSPELERYRDVKVRARARLAPLALLMLIAIALCIYFATR
jgi:predicted component of type VI protein secretion system